MNILLSKSAVDLKFETINIYWIPKETTNF